ncbi:Tn3 family transposase [Sinorhizobium sp. BJ1]|uniref:Tn3 family transposase n=1 Tax=Sinorhizobium sp. BJ1 TaxID=2035455 RepID=UPI0024782B0B|nr:Tn3 family transposase [Sinorhizobium sp. BJ1]
MGPLALSSSYGLRRPDEHAKSERAYANRGGPDNNLFDDGRASHCRIPTRGAYSYKALFRLWPLICGTGRGLIGARPALFFNLLGELRDRTFEKQFYRASGVNLLINAIVHWNMLYLEPAFAALNREGIPTPPNVIKHITPLGW